MYPEILLCAARTHFELEFVPESRSLFQLKSGPMDTFQQCTGKDVELDDYDG